MAWLNAAPDEKEGKPGKTSRRERMEAKGEQPAVPVLSAPYLARWLYDIGPTVSGSMGEAPVGYRDLVAWQEISGVELLPWEAGAIRTASAHYLVEKQSATDKSRPAPYTPERDEIVSRRQHVAKQVKSIFSQMKRA